MKSLIALTLGLVVFSSAAFAGDDCCASKKAAAAVCEKSKGAACESAKDGCPVAKAALRKQLTTHKGAQLASR
jgi:hypothetical protein